MTNTPKYMAFKDFYSYKRVAGVNINDFDMVKILDKKFDKFRITLSEGDQAIFVLNVANVSEEKLISLVRGSRVFPEMVFLDLIKDVCEYLLFDWLLEVSLMTLYVWI